MLLVNTRILRLVIFQKNYLMRVEPVISGNESICIILLAISGKRAEALLGSQKKVGTCMIHLVYLGQNILTIFITKGTLTAKSLLRELLGDKKINQGYFQLLMILNITGQALQ